MAARVLIHLLAGLDQGNIANLYQVRGGLLKMARDPADNDLMRREATALTRLQDAVDPFGVTARESRDSAEHPRSLAIAVLFDVTGSMRGVPRSCPSRYARLTSRARLR